MVKGLTSSGKGRVQRVAGVCGIISQFLSVTVLLVVAISNSSWFSWTEDHISAFGVEGSAKIIYNGGLVLIGLLGIIFAIGLGRYFLLGRVGQLSIVLLILGSTAVLTMGVFPRNWDFMHSVSTVAFFTLYCQA